MHKITKDFSILDKEKTILAIEIVSKESKNVLLSCCYIPPRDITKNLTDYLISIFQRAQNEKSLIISNFNLDCLDYNDDSNIKHFQRRVFQLGFVPLINKPKKVCKNSATTIGNINTNLFFYNNLKKVIIKSDIYDHFPIIFTIQTGKIKANPKLFIIYIIKETLTRKTMRFPSNNYLISIGGM